VTFADVYSQVNATALLIGAKLCHQLHLFCVVQAIGGSMLPIGFTASLHHMHAVHWKGQSVNVTIWCMTAVQNRQSKQKTNSHFATNYAEMLSAFLKDAPMQPL